MGLTRAEAEKILGLRPGWTPADEKAAYKRLAILTHPDKNTTMNKTKAHENMVRLNAAHALLTNKTTARAPSPPRRAPVSESESEGESLGSDEESYQRKKRPAPPPPRNFRPPQPAKKTSTPKSNFRPFERPVNVTNVNTGKTEATPRMACYFPDCTKIYTGKPISYDINYVCPEHSGDDVKWVNRRRPFFGLDMCAGPDCTNPQLLGKKYCVIHDILEKPKAAATCASCKSPPMAGSPYCTAHARFR